MLSRNNATTIIPEIIAVIDAAIAWMNDYVLLRSKYLSLSLSQEYDQDSYDKKPGSEKEQRTEDPRTS